SRFCHFYGCRTRNTAMPHHHSRITCRTDQRVIQVQIFFHSMFSYFPCQDGPEYQSQSPIEQPNKDGEECDNGGRGAVSLQNRVAKLITASAGFVSASVWPSTRMSIICMAKTI